ncbi:MAG: hypothetical protein RR543_06025 [Erysipelotrichales bacterium]
MDKNEIFNYVKSLIEFEHEEINIKMVFKEKNKVLRLYAYNKSLINFNFLKTEIRIEITEDNSIKKYKIKNESLNEMLLELKQKINDRYKILYESSSTDSFGCCSHYEECSNAKHCILDDEYANNCYYKKNLENNLIFYGVNRNID